MQLIEVDDDSEMDSGDVSDFSNNSSTLSSLQLQPDPEVQIKEALPSKKSPAKKRSSEDSETECEKETPVKKRGRNPEVMTPSTASSCSKENANE